MVNNQLTAFYLTNNFLNQSTKENLFCFSALISEELSAFNPGLSFLSFSVVFSVSE